MTDMKKMYEQIAHLQLMGTPQVHIAGVIGVSESRISQIIGEEEYKLIEAEISVKSYAQAKEQNERWLYLEEMATMNLMATVKFNKDPEINLKIALAANKADRRGHAIAPIVAQQGMRATISLPITYIQNIQNNGGVINQVDAKVHKEQNRIDILTPGKVESLLSGKTVKENMFAGIEFSDTEAAV